jgi:hypothetical protein
LTEKLAEARAEERAEELAATVPRLLRVFDEGV